MTTYVIASRASGNDYIAFPTLTKVGSRIYCCVREATKHGVDVSGSVGVYYSDDRGETWIEDTGLAITDASYDLRSGRLFLHSDGTLWVFYGKVNSGDTSRVVHFRKCSAPYSSWGTETAITSMTKADVVGRPIELASGRIVVPCYEAVGTTYEPFARWTDDDGASWTTDFLTSDGAAPGTYGDYTEWSVAEDPSTPGNLVAIIRRNSVANAYRQTSTDSGETWGTRAVNIAVDWGALDMPEIQYAQDGQLLLAYAKDRSAPEYLVKRSTDHGATWEADFAALWDNGTGSAGTPGGLVGVGGYCSVVEVGSRRFVAAFYHDNDNNLGPAVVFCTRFQKVDGGVFQTWTDEDMAHANMVEMTVTSVASSGTGTITLNAASSGYQSIFDFYGGDATIPGVRVTEGTAWEVFRDATYTHSGTTLTRGTFEDSSTGSAVAFTSAAVVAVVATADDGRRWDSAGLKTVASSADAAVTGVVGRLHALDISGFTANRTFELPAVAAVDDRIGIKITTGDDTYELLITAASGDTLETIAGGTEWSRLFITGESVVFRCIVANTTWIVDPGCDGRIPQQARMSLTTSDITTGSTGYNALLLSTTDYATGCTVTHSTTSKIKVRRANKFIVNASWAGKAGVSVADNEQIGWVVSYGGIPGSGGTQVAALLPNHAGTSAKSVSGTIMTSAAVPAASELQLNSYLLTTSNVGARALSAATYLTVLEVM